MSSPVHVCLCALAWFPYQLEIRVCAEKSVCTAVYLTQMFLLGLKCLSVCSRATGPSRFIYFFSVCSSNKDIYIFLKYFCVQYGHSYFIL